MPGAFRRKNKKNINKRRKYKIITYKIISESF